MLRLGDACRVCVYRPCIEPLGPFRVKQSPMYYDLGFPFQNERLATSLQIMTTLLLVITLHREHLASFHDFNSASVNIVNAMIE